MGKRKAKGNHSNRDNKTNSLPSSRLRASSRIAGGRGDDKSGAGTDIEPVNAHEGPKQNKSLINDEPTRKCMITLLRVLWWVRKKAPDKVTVLDELLKEIILALLLINPFSGHGSPTFFAVYAHDNINHDSKKAGSDQVRKLIEWLSEIHSKIISDRTPLFRSWPEKEDGFKSNHDILVNQTCLLPKMGNRSNGRAHLVGSVDKVILFCSELLEEYFQKMKAGEMKKYADEITNYFRNHENVFLRGSDEEVSFLKNGLQKCAGKYLKDPDFHHVLTELIFMELRFSREPHQALIPVVLGGNGMECLTIIKDKRSDFLIWMAPKENSKKSDWIFHETQVLHRLFFKILPRLFDKHHSLIAEFQKCYTACAQKLSPESGDSRPSEQAFMEFIKTQILRTVERSNVHAAVTLQTINNEIDLRRQDRVAVNYQTLGDAFAALNHYYSGSDCLTIERISGDQLPMSQCYINLAIVQQSKRENPEQHTSPFSLFARLKVDKVGYATQVALTTLFEQRKLSDGRTITPKRVLILGDAGVGKTTLCKKIVYDYINNQMWQQSFDCLLWIPLRRLKGTSERHYNLMSLIHDIYFTVRLDGESLAKLLAESVEDPNTRTLFLLDGLDEVSGEVDSQDGIGPFLRYLLQKPNVIITSRPHRLHKNSLGSLDLELETTGFYPDQVNAYVRNKEILKDPKKTTEILSFLRSNPLMQGLVRIPIQLDAMCFCWNTADFSNDTPQTMTSIYESITRKLWQKDILSLEKKYEGKRLRESTVQELDQWQVESVVSEELDLLRGLAFIGLYSNIIEFNSKDRAQIIRHLLGQGAKLPPFYNATFKRLSFLRTSDNTLPDNQQNYHFLHLTFEEFFAAQYFVKHWAENLKLQCLDLANLEKNISINPKDFLRSEKYTSRYNVFWRFVAGLMESKGDTHLLSFFQELGSEPRDLLGPAHQIIAMNCLCEVGPSNKKAKINDFKKIRDKIERELYLWMLYDIKSNMYPTFINQSELPENLLRRLLEENEEEIKIHALNALKKRPSVTSNIFDTVVTLYNTCVIGELKAASYEMLASKFGSLSLADIKVIVSALKDGDSKTRHGAATALAGQSSLPGSIFTLLVSSLKDGDSKIRRAAARAVGGQSSLPVSILNVLVSSLEDEEDIDMRRAIAMALAGQSSLPESILTLLVSSLKNRDSKTRHDAARALSWQSSLPESIFTLLVSSLKDRDSKTRHVAAIALGGQSSLPESILNLLVSSLEDRDSKTRHDAAMALAGQSSLPESILTLLVSSLKNRDSKTRYVAAIALGGQSSLPESIFTLLVSSLEDRDSKTRHGAATALAGQSSLPGSIFTLLVSSLKDRDPEMRQYAAIALGGQSSLPESILSLLVSSLKDRDSKTRHGAATALAGQSSLPGSILSLLVSSLKDEEDINIRQAIVTALDGQSNLPESILSLLVSSLKDEEDINIRQAIATALGRQSNLPQDILACLASSLEDDKSIIMSRAVARALAGQSNLPESILNLLVSSLEDRDWKTRRSAAYALDRQLNLPLDIVKRLVLLLHKPSRVETVKISIMLLKHECFYSMLPSLDTSQLKFLCGVWLDESFEEQISCYIQDGRVFINTSERGHEVLFERPEDFRNLIQEERLILGVPSD